MQPLEGARETEGVYKVNRINGFGRLLLVFTFIVIY